MRRKGYRIFSEGKIGNMRLKNRLVRSATWEAINRTRRVTDELLEMYRELAEGGVGLIITGLIRVVSEALLDGVRSDKSKHSYDGIQIDGLSRMADVVHRESPTCKIVAQISGGRRLGASEMSSPFPFPSSVRKGIRALSAEEIRKVASCFVEATVNLKEAGFDGVQLHGAHGKSCLHNFLSPYTNRRTDEYGGSAKNRARIIREIVSEARERVDDFPILIKMNCTDNVEGGVEIEAFPETAKAIERAGVDAIEVSGGTLECLLRTEEELGFRPVFSAESHTRINTPEKQSYYLKYSEGLELDIPVILVGGNRDVERLEKILHEGSVDFIALCRPLICEPDLPNRWLEGRGSSTTDCISCGSCRYCVHELKRYVATCLFKHDKHQHKMAQEWLSSWVEKSIQG
jgi:2,4-dienoyl-CoA reductase-like NADH-dependent reductase (Old Yellow Enzyme family)